MEFNNNPMMADKILSEWIEGHKPEGLDYRRFKVGLNKTDREAMIAKILNETNLGSPSGVFKKEEILAKTENEGILVSSGPEPDGGKWYYWDPNYKDETHPNGGYLLGGGFTNMEALEQLKKDLTYNRVGLLYVGDYNEGTGKIKLTYDKDLVNDLVYDTESGKLRICYKEGSV